MSSNEKFWVPFFIGVIASFMVIGFCEAVYHYGYTAGLEAFK